MPEYQPGQESEDWCREVILGRTGRVCEICRAHQWTDKHHIRNRSQGGGWTPDNVIGLCAACHGWITTNPWDAFTGGWTRRPSGSAIWLASLSLWPGWYWLDAWGSPYGYGSPDLARKASPIFPPHMPPELIPPRPITVSQRSHP